MSHKAKMLLLVLSFFGGILILSACGNQAGSPQVSLPDNPSAKTETPAQTPTGITPERVVTLKVYQADKDANHLVAEVHRLSKDKVGGQPARAALELLLAGTKNPNLVNVIPKGTKLKGIVIRDNIAYVDFSKDLLKNSGGSTQEIFIVGAIVNTLTEFSEIEKVQILVEGKKIETIAGHIDVSQPLSRSEKIIR